VLLELIMMKLERKDVSNVVEQQLPQVLELLNVPVLVSEENTLTLQENVFVLKDTVQLKVVKTLIQQLIVNYLPKSFVELAKYQTLLELNV